MNTISLNKLRALKLPKFRALAFFVFYITIIECRLQDVPNLPQRGSLFDLTVLPVVVDENVFEKDAVQLNISWRSADLGAQKIDVHLHPVPNEHCSHTAPCPAYDLPANTTHVLIPRDPMVDVIASHMISPICYVRLGCTYDVSVQTTGINVQRLRLTTRYTVPDCVDEVCICTHAHELPAVHLNATLDSNLLKIYWKIVTGAFDWDSENVSLSDIFIGVQMKPNARLWWGGQNLDISAHEIPLEIANDTILKKEGYHLVNLTSALANSTDFNVLIKAHVIDSRRCAGNESSYTYNVESNKTTVVYASNNHFVKVFLMCFFIVVLLLITGFIFTYRRMQHLLLTKSFVKNWRGFYQNVPSVGFKPIKFQENFLYGDEFEHCEIPHSSLKLSHNIGKGAFGSVYLAVANNIGPKECTGVVAVKKLKKDHNVEEMDEFLCEIAIMKSISRHPNVVALIGYCTVKQPMLMVMEYVGCGDLLNYLRRLREQHEQRTIAARRAERQMKQMTGKITDSGTSSTLNLISQSTNGNKSTKCYGNLPKSGCSSHTSATSLDNTITVTTLAKLEHEVNYLELCHSSTSDASFVTKPESIASTKRISDADDYTVFPNPEAISLECILDHKELHSFAVQIARGMKHLEDRGIIHRDLAARNILIDEHKQLKISDFGLSRSIIYVTRRSKKLPIRWMAIEALRENVYTSKSDVWSFAVVLWEIGTLGGIPYAHVCNELLLKHLADGHRLQRPEICSEQLYKLMWQCWSECPHDRPFFAEIVQKLENNECDEHVYVNFDDIASNYVFPPTIPIESDKPDLKEAEVEV